VALALPHQAKSIFIFFGDDDLTRPVKYVHTNVGEKYLLDYSRGGDWVLDRLVYNAYPFQRHFRYRLIETFPAYDWHQAFQTWISKTTFQLASGHPETEYRPTISKINRRFSFSRVRPVAPPTPSFGDVSHSAEELDASDGKIWEETFLPHMIEAARSQGVRLVFVRVERPANWPRPPRYAAYARALERYTTQRGAVFYDLDTLRNRIPDAWFADAHHVREELMPRYTESFFTRLSQEFR
jgi:hypothetical protein